MTYQELPQEIKNKLQVGFENQNWKQLDEAMLVILLKIVRYGYNTVFLHKSILSKNANQSGSEAFNLYFKSQLPTLTKLNLVYDERGDKNKILNYHVHPSLEIALYSYHPKLAGMVINNFAGTLSFTLEENESLYENDNVLYSGELILLEAVRLEPQMVHSYTVTLNSDGTVILKIAPFNLTPVEFYEQKLRERNFNPNDNDTAPPPWGED